MGWHRSGPAFPSGTSPANFHTVGRVPVPAPHNASPFRSFPPLPPPSPIWRDCCESTHHTKHTEGAAMIAATAFAVVGLVVVAFLNRIP